MADIGRTKPHITRIYSYGEYIWGCAIRGLLGAGLGHTAIESYRDWDEFVYKAQMGHKFKGGK